MSKSHCCLVVVIGESALAATWEPELDELSFNTKSLTQKSFKLMNRKVVLAPVVAKANMEELSQSRFLKTIPIGSADHELVTKLKVIVDKS